MEYMYNIIIIINYQEKSIIDFKLNKQLKTLKKVLIKSLMRRKDICFCVGQKRKDLWLQN